MKYLALFCSVIFSNLISFGQEISDDQYMNAFVVVVDSSVNYYDLRKEMFQLHAQLQIEIDTLGRSYDKTKDLICLPEGTDDEIYAGQYSPRRYPSYSLSLEYLRSYSSQNSENTIGLIALVSDDKEKATSVLEAVKPFSKNAFIQESKIYLGCIH